MCALLVLHVHHPVLRMATAKLCLAASLAVGRLLGAARVCALLAAHVHHPVLRMATAVLCLAASLAV